MPMHPATFPPAAGGSLASLPGPQPGAQPMALMALTPQVLKARIQAIQQVMHEVMIEDCHYGVVPGTDKPSLWKAGAEVICATFQLAPVVESVAAADYPDHVVSWKVRRKKWFNSPSGSREFTWETEDGETIGYYEIVATASIYGPDGRLLARCTGSANNLEAKYRTQFMYDVRNTIRKIAEKRALVGGILLATGASDIFTQDLEDMDEEVAKELRGKRDAKGAAAAGQKPTDTKAPATNGLNDKQNGLAAVKAKEFLGLQGEALDAFMMWFRHLDTEDNGPKKALDLLTKGGDQAKKVLAVYEKHKAAAAQSAPAGEAKPAAGDPPPPPATQGQEGGAQ